MKERFLIVIAGPTAVGKTTLSVELALQLQTEVLSADSRQLYREMTIGTAKPTKEEMAGIPHHFIDCCSISEALYSASRFEAEGLQLLDRLFQHYSAVIMTGGSGLYVNALCHGFDDELPASDPALREELNRQLSEEGILALQERLGKLDPDFYREIDLNNPNRLIRAIEVCLLADKPYSQIRKGRRKKRPFRIIKIGLEREREELYNRINKRVDEMITAGLEKEVRALEPHFDQSILKTVGYQEMFSYLHGEMEADEAIEKIKVNSRRYAKRQLTWFRKDEEYNWFHPDQKDEILEFILEKMKPSESGNRR